MSLKTQAQAGIRWTAASTCAVALIQLAEIGILAHFLEPADFGLMAMTMVVIGLFAAFTDSGTANAIIHQEKLFRKQLSSLYWLNIAIGIVLCCLVNLVAPLVERFYGEQRIADLLLPLSLILAVTPVGSQFRALCQRHLRFDVIGKIDVVGAAASLIVSSTMAWQGFGVTALVAGAVVGASLSGVLFGLIGVRLHYFPTFHFRASSLHRLLRFGAFQMGERAINFFNAQVDVLLIGKVLGSEAAGIYYLAKNLTTRVMQFINPIVTKVTLPIMARLQEDKRTLRTTYLKTIRYVSLVSAPVFIAMTMLAAPTIYILFDDAWVDAVPLLQILALFTMVRSMINPVGSLLLARGRPDLGFFWNSALLFLMPAATYIGSYWGARGVAAASLALILCLKVPVWYWLVRPLCDARLGEYVNSLFHPVLLAVAAALAAAPFMLVENLWLKGALVTTVLVGTYLVLLRFFAVDFLEIVIGTWRLPANRVVPPSST